MTELRGEFVPGMAEIAREAGALLMEFFRQRVKIEYKGDVDLACSPPAQCADQARSGQEQPAERTRPGS